MVILDGSNSMTEAHQGQKKFNLAWNLAYRLNQTIPEIPLVGALRTFGTTPCPFRENTELLYGATAYTPEGFEDGLKSVKTPGGVSPLYLSLAAAAEDLKSTQGPIALIIFSDFMQNEEITLQTVENLKSQYSGRICIYPVLIGNNASGIQLQEKIVQAAGCGFAANGNEIYSNADMAGFVESVFMGAKVVSAPAPALRPSPVRLDSDGDGVTDDLDRCPETPRCATVNEVGCWVIKGINFDFDQADIKPQYAANLNKVADCFKQYPNISFEIQGHTDSKGTTEYNQKLSERRANAVMEYLILRGAARDRLKAVGYGASDPVASNNTDEGRAQNRRVQINIIR
jgi:OOP family OmpA-OmpF porin